MGEYKATVGANTQAGKAYIYTGSSRGVGSTPYWTGQGTSSNQFYGFAMASADSILDQTIYRTIVGVPGYSNGQSLEGAAFIYYARCN